MSSEAPPFWWGKPDWKAWLLSPFGLVYRFVADRHMLKAMPPKIAAPVICIGNFTVGGSGKTPTAIALAKAAKELGFKPGFISRGYGGHVTGLHLVDAKHDSARHVGDEPLILAKTAPTCVGADRHRGAEMLLQNGCDMIIMDDGFQSRHIHIDFALCAVDGRRGIGNGFVIPAGPLRASIRTQMMLTDGLVINGQGGAAVALVRIASRAGKPVFHADYKPTKRLKKKPVLAFAGIADPAKFFATLESNGFEVLEKRAFADHHPFKPNELKTLTKEAEALSATLITTEKDAARLQQGTSIEQAFLKSCEILTVRLDFDAPDAPQRIVTAAQEAFNRRI